MAEAEIEGYKAAILQEKGIMVCQSRRAVQ
jgi:hypothetical protein